MKNIVMIIMDECKASILPAYGYKYGHTPNMDKFCEDALVFEKCFTTMPKCVPARTCLMTSRYCHTDGHRTLPGFEVLRGEKNLIKILKDSGYKTGMFGKNHTFMADAMAENLDMYNIEQLGIDVPWARRDFEQDDDLFRAFYRGDFTNIPEMSDNIATKRFEKFVDENKTDNFCAVINYNAPHPPYTDISPFIEIIRQKNLPLPKVEKLEDCPKILSEYRKIYNLEDLTDEQWRKVVEAYCGLVAYIDSEIGAVINKLKVENLYDDTLLIITSDHGDFAGEHGCVEKWDTMFYDCLTHIPLMIKLPKDEHGGQRRSTLCEIVDIAPTVLECIGMDVPQFMMGKSLTHSIKSESYVHKTEVFSEGGVERHALGRSLHYNTPEHAVRHPNYPYKQMLMVDSPHTMYRAKMVRTDEWKLIYRDGGEIELYNLISDPNEFHDVAKENTNASIINSLILKLLDWCVKTETDYPWIDIMYS